MNASCNYLAYGSCNTEVVWIGLAFLLLVVIGFAALIWFHDHNNHKPWRLKCGWVKVDGMWHFFSREVTPEEPYIFGGTSCTGMKCAKGMQQAEQKIDFVKYWKEKSLDKPSQEGYNTSNETKE